MPLKYKIDPHKKKINRTLCQVLRDIWNAGASKDTAYIRGLAEEAFDKAKRMDAKLKWYHERYGDK